MPEQANDEYLDDSITLEILSAVEEDSRITQRNLSDNLGIALGLTNYYVQRCLKKGLIKIITAPANRYAYYLTPEGFSEKSRLTREFLSQSFKFFRVARHQCSEVFEKCAQNGWHNVLLVGVGDLCEIATLCANVWQIKPVAVYDPAYRESEFCGLKVCSRLDQVPNYDAVILVDLGLPREQVFEFETVVGVDRVFVPDILGIARERGDNLMSNNNG